MGRLQDGKVRGSWTALLPPPTNTAYERLPRTGILRDGTHHGGWERLGHSLTGNSTSAQVHSRGGSSKSGASSLGAQAWHPRQAPRTGGLAPERGAPGHLALKTSRAQAGARDPGPREPRVGLPCPGAQRPAPRRLRGRCPDGSAAGPPARLGASARGAGL